MPRENSRAPTAPPTPPSLFWESPLERSSEPPAGAQGCWPPGGDLGHGQGGALRKSCSARP
eukprot:3735330-Alexandrium_andersonii.AAC.1